jgi:hypothetical protein
VLLVERAHCLFQKCPGHAEVNFDCENTVLGDPRSPFVETKCSVASVLIVKTQYLMTPKFLGTPLMCFSVPGIFLVLWTSIYMTGNSSKVAKFPD